MEQDVPQIKINSLTLRMRSFSLRSTASIPKSPSFDFDKLPKYNEFKTLAHLLRACMHEHDDGPDRSFLPPALLSILLSREAIQYELNEYQLDAPTLKSVLLNTTVDAIEESDENLKTYLVVFAILILLGKGKEIVHCISCPNGVCDQDLPLLLYNQMGNRELRLRDNSKIDCFNEWDPHVCESFENYQWRLTVPTFALNEDNTIIHQELHDRAILPWCEEHLQTSYPTMSGGFGSVKRVRIHPLCHEFHDVLKEVRSYKDSRLLPRTSLWRRTVAKDEMSRSD